MVGNSGTNDKRFSDDGSEHNAHGGSGIADDGGGRVFAGQEFDVFQVPT